MDKFDRIFQLHNVLSGRRTAIPAEELMARLECSKATLHRTINALRSRYAPAPSSDPGHRLRPARPVVQPHRTAGAGTDAKAGAGRGRWPARGTFRALGQAPRAAHAAPAAEPGRSRRAAALSRAGRPSRGHLRVSATLRTWIEYHARSTDERTERTVSPQRIVHYRETWYLDAWDDSRDALRSFATDRVLRATVLEDDALDVPDEQMDEHYTTAYGIFGGKADKMAVLRFTPERARWVADERWHPDQEGTWLPDGCFCLSVPYRQSRELVMDILRHGSGVEVLSPRELVEEVRAELEAACRRYNDAK